MNDFFNNFLSELLSSSRTNQEILNELLVHTKIGLTIVFLMGVQIGISLVKLFAHVWGRNT